MTDSDHTPSPTHCISCGAEVPDHAKFCQACGSAVYRPEDTSQPPEPAPTRCSICGTELPDHLKYCPEDKSQLPEPAPAESPVPETSTEPTREPVASGDVLPETPKSHIGKNYEGTSDWSSGWMGRVDSPHAFELAPELSAEEGKGLTFLEAVSSGFSKYAVFSGRALRSEYWYWYLFTVIANTLAMLNDDLLFHFMVVLILVLPNIAVAARRLHDVGRSGWWQLVVLTGVGWIPFLYWMCKRGDVGENRYGLPVIPASEPATKPSGREPLYGEDAYASTEPVSPVPEASTDPIDKVTSEPTPVEAPVQETGKKADVAGLIAASVLIVIGVGMLVWIIKMR